jgi:type VI protein secretion system component VasF
MTKRAKRPNVVRLRKPTPPTPAERARKDAEDEADRQVLAARDRQVIEAAERERKWLEGEKRRARRRSALLVWTVVLCGVAIAVTVWALNH